MPKEVREMRTIPGARLVQLANSSGDEDDGLEEIDLNNIVEGGRRTRGQVIDFAKAAEENPAEDDDEEDDDDFTPPDEDTKMSG